MREASLESVYRLAQALEDGLLGAGELATYRSVARVLGVPEDEVGPACRDLAKMKETCHLPLHRIVGERGFLAMYYPDEYVARLLAERRYVGATAKRSRFVYDFEDSLADREPLKFEGSNH